MPDIVDTKTRSRMMAGIRGKDTRPELLLRKALHARGYRYRVHVRFLPGSPDMVFPRFRAVVLVHGCFWHRHPGCPYATIPGTNPEFWQTKFDQNVRRDAHQHDALRAAGWRVAIVWECATRSEARLMAAVDEVSEWLRSDRIDLELPVLIGSG